MTGRRFRLICLAAMLAYWLAHFPAERALLRQAAESVNASLPAVTLFFLAGPW